ncbi:MAG: hypothetical protein RL113_1314 [Pseudomonadota bacterium]|jgi:phosphopantothenoylcysteine decarboxylase/phosphopantothenate--cysteine ligase
MEKLNNIVLLLLRTTLFLSGSKNVDAVCYNLLKDSNTFGTFENEITFITANKEVFLGRDHKLTLADKIVQEGKQRSDA